MASPNDLKWLPNVAAHNPCNTTLRKQVFFVYTDKKLEIALAKRKIITGIYGENYKTIKSWLARVEYDRGSPLLHPTPDVF